MIEEELTIQEQIERIPTQSLERAIQYAKDIVSGEILACKDVISQCRTFLEDYEVNQYRDDFRWYFDEEAASDVLEFSTICRFPKGDPVGLPLKMSDWHSFVLANVYGWRNKRNKDDLRFTDIICLVARKNSKTMLMSVVALYELLLGNESTEMTIAATQMKQAKLLFNDVDKMRQQLPEQISKKLKKTLSAISNEKTWSSLEPVSRDTGSLEGKGVVKGFFDEAALVENGEVFETILTSMSPFTGRQAFFITTAQAGASHRPFYARLEYARDVVRGTVKDERLFALLYSLDEEDREDWTNPDKWIKANPSWGHSIKRETMLEDLRKLKTEEQKVSFRARRLNIFEDSAQTWIPTDEWDKNTVAEIDRSLPLTIGLDLAAVKDLSAVTAIYGPDKDKKFYFESKCFIPRRALDEAEKSVRGVYLDAVKSGVLVPTDTPTTDQQAIKRHILELVNNAQDFREVCYDPALAGFLVNELEEAGVECVMVAQNWSNMSPASKDMETAILEGRLKHLGNPFFKWQLGCAEVKIGENDNYRVVKPSNKRERKIDSIIAGIIALSRACLNEPKIKYATVQFLNVG